MEICLKTQLKGTVQNDSLLYLGEILVKVTIPSSPLEGDNSKFLFNCIHETGRIRSIDGKSFDTGFVASPEVNLPIGVYEFAITDNSHGYSNLQFNWITSKSARIELDMNTFMKYIHSTYNQWYNFTLSSVVSNRPFDVAQLGNVPANTKFNDIRLYGENFFGSLSDALANKKLVNITNRNFLYFVNTRITGSVTELISILEAAFPSGTITEHIDITGSTNIDRTHTGYDDYPDSFDIRIADGVATVIVS